MRVTYARVACVALAVAAAAAWTARGGSDAFVMWLMAPFLVAAAGRTLPTVVAAALPAAALVGTAEFAGSVRIDAALLGATATALTCAGLVLAAEAHNRRPAGPRPPL